MRKVLVIIILLSVTGLSAGSYKQGRQPKPDPARTASGAMDDQKHELDEMLIKLKSKR